MNQHTNFLEYNGYTYVFKNVDHTIQWFVVKGHKMYPHLEISYLTTLGKIWYNETKLEVAYKKTNEQIKYIESILNNIYESRCEIN
jgi:hypothetical protein